MTHTNGEVRASEVGAQGQPPHPPPPAPAAVGHAHLAHGCGVQLLLGTLHTHLQYSFTLHYYVTTDGMAYSMRWHVRRAATACI
jgi:hypothetical protein